MQRLDGLDDAIFSWHYRFSPEQARSNRAALTS
jgi:hypothetical protein